jgi:hypothetical protein
LGTGRAVATNCRFITRSVQQNSFMIFHDNSLRIHVFCSQLVLHNASRNLIFVSAHDPISCHRWQSRLYVSVPFSKCRVNVWSRLVLGTTFSNHGTWNLNLHTSLCLAQSSVRSKERIADIRAFADVFSSFFIPAAVIWSSC